MKSEYICDDREKEIPERILNMSKEEFEKEFIKRFGETPEEAINRVNQMELNKNFKI